MPGHLFTEGKLDLLTSVCKDNKDILEQKLLPKSESTDHLCLTWGSACSGSEGVSYVFKALEETYKEGACKCGRSFSFTHCFSCESDEKKRRWIQTVVSEEGPEKAEKCVFTDIGSIGAGVTGDGRIRGATAYCDTHKKECLVPACDIFVCGTSCKDISVQGSLKGRYAGAPVLQGSWSPGGSAQTFRGFIGYCQWAQPSIVLFENVENLATESLQDSQPPPPSRHMPTPFFPATPAPRLPPTGRRQLLQPGHSHGPNV